MHETSRVYTYIGQIARMTVSRCMYIPVSTCTCRLVEAGRVKQFHLHTGGQTDILLGSWDRQTHEVWYKKNKEKLDQQRKRGWVLVVM